MASPVDPNAVLIDPDGLASMAFAPEGASNLLGLRRTLGPTDADQGVLVPLTREQGFLDYLPIPADPRGGHAVGN